MQNENPVPAPSVSRLNPLPAPVTNVAPAAAPVRMGPPPHFLAAFFFSLFLGVFGVDRFYLRRYPSAVFKLLTFGGFGIQAIVDLALIMNNALRDKYERPLVGYEEYKGLAKKTVVWTTVIVGTFIILNVGLLALSVIGLVNSFNGATKSGGLPQIPGFDTSQLQGTGL